MYHISYWHKLPPISKFRWFCLFVCLFVLPLKKKIVTTKQNEDKKNQCKTDIAVMKQFNTVFIYLFLPAVL